MNDKFTQCLAEYKAYQATAFAELHKLVDKCDLAETKFLEVLARCH